MVGGCKDNSQYNFTYLSVTFVIAVTQFQTTMETNCTAVISCMNVSYIVGL